MKKRIFPAILLAAGATLTAMAFYPEWKSEILLLLFSIGVPLFLIGLFRLFFTKTAEKHFHFSTTLTSLGMSAFTGSGLVCGFLMAIPGRSTVMLPASALVVAVSLFMCVTLLVLYFVFRSWRWSWLGFLLDAVRGFMFVPAFWVTSALLINIVRNLYKYGQFAISVIR